MAQWFQKWLARDQDISGRLRYKRHSGWRWGAAVFLAHSGDSWFWLVGLIALWLLGGAFWRHTAVVFAVGTGSLAVLVFGVKQLFRRQRPAGEWGSIYRTFDPHSFPSGHASRAAMLAVLGLHLGPAWFALLLLLWAPLVAISRVRTGVHFLSDILAGALLGALMAGVVIWLEPHLTTWLPFLF